MRSKKRPLLGSTLSVPIEFVAAITDCRLTASDELPQVGSFFGRAQNDSLALVRVDDSSVHEQQKLAPLMAIAMDGGSGPFSGSSPRLSIQPDACRDRCVVTAKLTIGWKLHSIIGHCRTLRDFFHFAGAQGWCEPSFYLGIRVPRLVARPIEPKAPEWSEVRRLLLSFQKPTASDRRAKAMVMLCALYGLRSIEVFRLELGDIDWRNATFVVRRAKRGGIQHFPLLHDVGEAILDYLKNGRPKRPSRLLFLSMRPPYGKVSSTSLWRAIGPQLRDMGSRVDYVGAHCLRHV